MAANEFNVECMAFGDENIAKNIKMLYSALLRKAVDFGHGVPFTCSIVEAMFETSQNYMCPDLRTSDRHALQHALFLWKR